MANSTYLTIKGKAYWARVFEENRDMEGYDGLAKATNGQYTINMVLDSDTVHRLSEANSQSVDYPKTVTDEDGNSIVAYRFKRVHEKRNSAGEMLEWASGSPKVIGPDGSPWSIEDNGLIGNGSEVELTVVVYKAGHNYGTRLEKVKVLNHIPAPSREVA